jgi:hypothetical protein
MKKDARDAREAKNADEKKRGLAAFFLFVGAKEHLD